MTTPGHLYGVGVGPGDPELMSVKAHRLISSTPTVAYFAAKGRPSNARAVAAHLLTDEHVELRIEYPVTTEALTGAAPVGFSFSLAAPRKPEAHGTCSVFSAASRRRRRSTRLRAEARVPTALEETWLLSRVAARPSRSDAQRP